MGFQVQDGQGRGYAAGVNAANRLMAESVSTSESIQATFDGLAYNVNSGIITLNSATESAVAYMKNTGTLSLHIEALAVGLGIPASATSGDVATIDVLRNPTGGTIIDNAIKSDIVENRNFGATARLTADTYKGAAGYTFTDGDVYFKFYQTTPGRLFATVDSVLTPGDTIGVTITPPASNTSMTCYVALILHEIERMS